MTKKKPTEIELDKLYADFERYARNDRGYFVCANLSDLNVFVDWLHTQEFVIVRSIVSTAPKHGSGSI